MKRLLCLLLFVGAAGPAFSSAIGDTYDQVIAEKGQPASHMESGTLQILSYPDATIKLRDNVVVSIKAPEPSVPRSTVPQVPHPAPTAVSGPGQDPGAPVGNSFSWGTDYTLAASQAKQSHRHIFLFFTGSDWCGWCMKLQKDILTTNEFVQYAKEHLVLVELDYPKSKPMSAELRAQNHMLQEKYAIRGFPTVVVLDQTGKQVAKMVGYQKGGPGPFIAQIQALGD